MSKFILNKERLQQTAYNIDIAPFLVFHVHVVYTLQCQSLSVNKERHQQTAYNIDITPFLVFYVHIVYTL